MATATLVYLVDGAGVRVVPSPAMTDTVKTPPNPYQARSAAWSAVAAKAQDVAIAESDLRDAERELWACMTEMRRHLSLRDLESLTGIGRATLANHFPAVRVEDST